MKRTLILLLALVLCFAFIACNVTPKDSDSDFVNTDKTADSEAESNQGASPDTKEPGLTNAEKRSLKVSFDLSEHDSWDYDSNYVGLMALNSDGNEYIAYAQNVYQFYVIVNCKSSLADAYLLVKQIENKYFSYYNEQKKTVILDTIRISSDEIMVVFPNFNSYYECQEELLDKLSEKEYVNSIKVGYIKSQDGTKEIKNGYKYINLPYFYTENQLIKSYEEFEKISESILTNSEDLQQITEQTFDENYVFIVTNFHHSRVEITDARLVGDTVYFTNNEYSKKGELVDAIEFFNACLTIVSKEELGVLPKEVSVKAMTATVFYDE